MKTCVDCSIKSMTLSQIATARTEGVSTTSWLRSETTIKLPKGSFYHFTLSWEQITILFDEGDSSEDKRPLYSCHTRAVTPTSQLHVKIENAGLDDQYQCFFRIIIIPFRKIRTPKNEKCDNPRSWIIPFFTNNYLFCHLWVVLSIEKKHENMFDLVNGANLYATKIKW